jgi:hypothetical protein
MLHNALLSLKKMLAIIKLLGLKDSDRQSAFNI